jgi:septal ring factor EnvC (AmiA/AmiB activator)
VPLRVRQQRTTHYQGTTLPPPAARCPQNVEYTAGKSEIPLWKSAFMAVNAIERVAEQVPADDFQALEEKIYRTIEKFKAARQAQAAAERDAQRLRQQLEERDQEVAALRREAVQLKKEREEIRGRVEKMLEQIESIAEAS